MTIREIVGARSFLVQWWARVWLALQLRVIVLWRMRQSGFLAPSAGTDTQRLQEALAGFGTQRPDLKRMRDVAQHFAGTPSMAPDDGILAPGADKVEVEEVA